MPNWTTNKVVCSKEIALKVLGKENDEDIFDFNKLIPMPKELDLTSGSIEYRAICYYYNSLNKSDKLKLRNMLKNKEVFFYGNYLNKYKDRLKATKKDLEEYNTKFMNNKDNFDNTTKFNSLYELGKRYIENIKDYNYANWFDWCNVNWGTKWNSCDNQVFIDEETGDYNFVFETAWSVPYEIVKEYSKLCKDEEFLWIYWDEGYNEMNILTKSDGKIVLTIEEPDLECDDCEAEYE